MTKLNELFTPPFRYDKNGAVVHDANGILVADVRAFGYIESKSEDGKEACETQDQLGYLIAEGLNRVLAPSDVSVGDEK
jgi:hypothetical protein